MKTLLVLALMLFVPSLATAKIKRITIYHVPWNIVTAVSMSADAVRKHAAIKIEISEGGFPSPNCESFVRWLDEESMQEDASMRVSDLRLVIDIEDDTGGLSSFYANRFALLAVKSGKRRSIGDSFRSRFSFYYDERVGLFEK